MCGGLCTCGVVRSVQLLSGGSGAGWSGVDCVAVEWSRLCGCGVE